MNLEGKQGQTYKLTRKISEDHFITSYLAKKNEKSCRLFLFPTKNVSYPFFLTQKLISGNRSASIPAILDSGKFDDSISFITIPYHKSSTLRSLLSTDNLNINKTLKIILTLFSQVKEAHRAGLIGFRMRPEDVYINSTGQLKVFPYFFYDRTDLLEMISSEKFLTDVLYLAPEQIKNFAVSKASDYYALGIIFYEMLFGIAPFYEEKNVEVIKLHLESNLPEPENFSSDDHRKLLEIIKLLLSKDPLQRLGYAAQAENELLTILHRDVRSWNPAYLRRIKSTENNIDQLGENSKNVIHEIIEKSKSLNLLQGSFFWMVTPSGYPVRQFLQNLISALSESTSNIIFFNPYKSSSSGWQGISAIVSTIMEQIKNADRKVYETFLENSVIKLLSEKDYQSTIYSDEYFSSEEIEKKLHAFFESVTVWSPFILIIQDFDKLDQKSKNFILHLSKNIPEMPLTLLITSQPGHAVPEHAQEKVLNGLTRTECVKLIQKELDINEKKALLIYNKIIIKAGNMILNLRLFIHWLKTHPDNGEKVPVSIVDLIRKSLVSLDERQLKLLQEVVSWPFPPGQSFFAPSDIMIIEGLVNNYFLSRDFSDKDCIIPYHPVLREVLNTLFPIREKFNNISAHISALLEKQPWLWHDYLGNLNNFKSKGLDVLLRSVDYYMRVNCFNDAVSLLDVFIENFSDFQEHDKVNQKYLNIYMQIGSYDAAFSFLKRIMIKNPDDRDLLLLQLFLLVKMDRDLEAENLIAKIEKLADISDKDRATLDFNIAQLLAREKKYQPALIKFASSRKIFSSMMNFKSLQDVLKAEVAVLRIIGQFDKSMKLLKSAKSNSAHNRNPDMQFWILKQMGDICLLKEDFLKAAEFYQEAFEIPKTIQSEEEYAQFQFNRGGLQWLIGDSQTALLYFQDSAKRYKKLGRTKDYLKSLGNQAVIFRETGQLGMAMEMESGVLEMSRTISDKNVISVSLNSLGYIYSDVNQLQSAKDCFDTVIKMSKKSVELIELFRAYLGKASVYLKEGLHREAGKYLEKAKKINPENLGYFRNDLNYFLSKLTFYQGNYDESIKYAQSFLQSTRISFRYQAIGKYLLAENLKQTGDIDQAKQLLGESFNLARIAGLEPVMQKVLWLKSQIHYQNNEMDKAKKSLDQCLMLFHKISGSLKTEIDQLIYKESLEFARVFEWHKNHFGES